MTPLEPVSMRQRLTAPRAAGVAGVLFALLFGTSIVFMRTALDRHTDTAVWTSPEAAQIRFALGLMPYAGIAFLWFIGVVRDRLGDLEDKFFATVFFGSGLVFIAMIFASSAIAGGILTAAQQLDAGSAFGVTAFARAEMLEITNVYALRMAGVFMISLGTVWLRTRLMRRWTVVLTYALALALLVMINLSLWVQLIFPAWTLLISVLILIRSSQSEMHLTD
jgi:hypothetical protein